MCMNFFPDKTNIFLIENWNPLALNVELGRYTCGTFLIQYGTS
jgi:hypothetical protein